ncbi:MAG: hypothetical protein ABIY35_09215 [Chitinophagaceae bacterium]
MKYLVTFLLVFMCTTHTHAQTKKIDSLNRLISLSRSDTQRINLKIKKLSILENGNLDSAIAFAKLVIGEAQQINYKNGEVNARMRLASD